MLALIGLVALIYGLGGMLRVPLRTRLLAIGAVYLGAVLAAALLPEASPLRQSLGGSPAPLLALAMVGGAVMAYRGWLRRLRARAQPAAEASNPAPQTGLADPKRHARHIMLRDIGGPGQAKLAQARVLVIGAGGLGLPAAGHLHAAGIGTVGLIDPDRVELSNLPRQILYAEADIGLPKVQAAQQRLLAQNESGAVRPYHRRFNAEIAADLFADYDLVLEGSDSFAAKQLANRTAIATNTALILAALSPWEAQMLTVLPGQDQPCYACLFPNPPAPETAPSCTEAGVVAPLPHLTGAAMALEAIKHLTGAGESQPGTLWSLDGRSLTAERFAARRVPDCPVCAGSTL